MSITDFTHLSPDNVIEIVSQAIGASKSIPEIFDAVSSVESLYSQSWEARVGKRNVPEFMNDGLRTSIRGKLGLRVPGSLPPEKISKYDGILQFMLATENIDSFWAYYLIKTNDNALRILNSHGHTVYTMNGSYLGQSNKYLLIYNADNIKIEALSYNSKKQIYIVASMDSVVSTPLMISESKDGLVIGFTTEFDNLHVYLLIDNNFVRIVFTHSPESSEILGYTGYYIEDTVHSYVTAMTYPVYIEGSESVFNQSSEIVSDNGMGIDIITINESSTDILYCKTNNGVSTVLWSSELHYDISSCDSIIASETQVKDIFTGRDLIDTENIVLEQELKVIKGVTKKEDDSGYYIWLHQNNIKYEVIQALVDYLKSIRFDTRELIGVIPLPETGLEHISFGSPANVVRTYSRYIGNFITSYDTTHLNRYPFAVYSFYSLYPYFHYMMTGKYTLVMAFNPHSRDFKIIGYSKSGHRKHHTYALDSFNLAQLEEIYGDSLLFFDSSQAAIDLAYRWINNFIDSKDYRNADRETKIRMIDASIDQL